MQEALYHPDFGYYTANINAVGGLRSDFTTAPELSALPAKAIATWILEEASLSPFLNNSKPLHVIEVGGGDGSMARSIFQSWNWWQRRKIRYHLVEISPCLRQRQQENLQAYRNRCQWHSAINSALKVANGCAVVFSNELIDAFPALALRWNGDPQQWEEIHLTFARESGLQEVFVPLGKSLTRELRCWHSVLKEDKQSSLQNGVRRELHRSAHSWMKGWIEQLHHGSMLTIDYGNHLSPLYHRRPGGTLRAYYQHQRLNGAALYQRFGRQDLTADVNFTDLENWGEHFGFEPIRFESLKSFTHRYAPQTDTTPPADHFSSSSFVTDPSGSGEAFQTLLQRKV